MQVMCYMYDVINVKSMLSVFKISYHFPFDIKIYSIEYASIHLNNLILAGQQSCLFYFGVKFYAADPTKLQEEITRWVKQTINGSSIVNNLYRYANLYITSCVSLHDRHVRFEGLD